jgi:hypothetical protein
MKVVVQIDFSHEYVTISKKYIITWGREVMERVSAEEMLSGPTMASCSTLLQEVEISRRGNIMWNVIASGTIS